ncbi:hypothetical protein IEQ34_001503 [Dendrobium chrysotoxum]|uniref:Uncharacterized protein n=1 Tax=Dendrobium chrysotoxum TaxID=161865 RepID=A0AAV7HP91_DENCH|nr:hypothetical protein IEQ34_001503 [Dendrobium chrysotoxum]
MQRLNSNGLNRYQYPVFAAVDLTLPYGIGKLREEGRREGTRNPTPYYAPFGFSLVGKFLAHQPSLDAVKKFFFNLKSSIEFSITLLNPRHVLIKLSNDLDYSRLFDRESYYLIKWSFFFVYIGEESLIVPIWCFDWVGIPFSSPPNFGYVQKIVMSDFPSFGDHYKLIGHEKVDCYYLHPHLRKQKPVNGKDRSGDQNFNLKLYKFYNAWSLQTPGIARSCCPLATVQISSNFVQYFASYGRLKISNSGSTRAIRSRLQARSDGPEWATWPGRTARPLQDSSAGPPRPREATWLNLSRRLIPRPNQRSDLRSDVVKWSALGPTRVWDAAPRRRTTQ